MEYFLDPKGDLSKYKTEYPELNVPDEVLRYIILMFDLNSEYRELYVDYATRKREVAIKAGFAINPDSRKFDRETEDILVGKNEQVNKAIICYVLLQNNPDALLYVAYNEMLSKEIENSLTEDDPRIIKYTRENIQKIGLARSDIEEKIFGGREVSAMRRALYVTLVTDGNVPRPETIAKAIAEGNLDIGVDPYFGK